MRNCLSLQKKFDMLLTNKQIKDLKDGVDSKRELYDYIISTYSVSRIVDEYLELIMKCDITDNKITVSQEEYETIISLFKVKGTKMVNGAVVPETRGRKPKKG